MSESNCSLSPMSDNIEMGKREIPVQVSHSRAWFQDPCPFSLGLPPPRDSHAGPRAHPRGPTHAAPGAHRAIVPTSALPRGKGCPEKAVPTVPHHQETEPGSQSQLSWAGSNVATAQVSSAHLALLAQLGTQEHSRSQRKRNKD